MTYLHNEIVSVRLQKQSLNSIDPMLRMKRELRRAHEKYFYRTIFIRFDFGKNGYYYYQSTEKHPLVRSEFHEPLEQIHDSKILSSLSCLFKKMKANDFFLPKKVEKKSLNQLKFFWFALFFQEARAETAQVHGSSYSQLMLSQLLTHSALSCKQRHALSRCTRESSNLEYLLDSMVSQVREHIIVLSIVSYSKLPSKHFLQRFFCYYNYLSGI